MIVKNESHIISKTLENIISNINISYWVICDTGSTDNTQSIIKTFFDKHNIPGELYDISWNGFGHARTTALNYVYNKSDYVIVFDADDSIIGDLTLSDLSHDQIYLKFDDKFRYYRAIILNNKIKWYFKGIIHEYVDTDYRDFTTGYIDGDYYINSGKIGHRNKNPKKYFDDALLIANELEKETDKHLISRYKYYCAQSYYDYGDYNNALKYYHMVLEDNNWLQEKYISCLRIGYIYMYHMGNPLLGLVYLNGCKYYDKTRLDAVYILMVYYYNLCDYCKVIDIYNEYSTYDNPMLLNHNYLLLNVNAYSDMRKIYHKCKDNITT